MTKGVAQAIQLIVVSAVIGVGLNAVREEGLSYTEALDADEPPPSPEQGADLPAGSAGDAVRRWEEGALFLDVRARPEFEERRIAGAFLLTADEFDTRYFEAVATLPLEIPLFVYGAGPDSHRVRRVAAELMEYGHEDVSLVVCGLDDLVAAGIDQDSGPSEGMP